MEQVKPGIMLTNGYSGYLRIWGKRNKEAFCGTGNVLYLIWMVGT